MKIDLSKHQRYAALAAAVIILIVLYLQIEDEGFSGYGWVLALLAAVALVIVSIGPVGTVASTPVQTASKPSPSKEDLDIVHKRLRDNAGLLAIEVEELAKVITQDLGTGRPDGFRLVSPDGRPSPVEVGVESFIRDRALLFSLGLVGIRQARDHHLYVTGIEYKDTERRIFDVLARESISGMMAMGLPVDKDKLLPQLLAELQSIRKCIVHAAEAAKRGDGDVSTPLVAWLAGHGLKISNGSIIETALQRGSIL
ncbi:hypothetical protein [Rhizobium leguminosarum]|uniref:hypothetical protein n=1 Tax=Rhizobium leguminosarum TaxID=384 RepID=UPI00103BDCE1|nr:hypothetical protein [Rhizobium leguminosarum]TCA26247.1 hypothetical protein E0H67_04830 [Rhizobium leguminosarum bv. viciae]